MTLAEAGATITTAGVKQAVEDALAQAGAENMTDAAGDAAGADGAAGADAAAADASAADVAAAEKEAESHE